MNSLNCVLCPQNFDVSSVQDSRNSRSNSKGLSVSASLSGDISGVGANMGMSHAREKQTVLTTLHGNQVKKLVKLPERRAKKFGAILGHFVPHLIQFAPI